MIRFADFEFSAADRQLYRGGRPLPLRERGFDVLLALIERAGQVVSKRDLCRRAWPEREVGENNLQVEILGLRKLLGKNAIVTAQGRGYQFTLPLAAAGTAPATRAGPTLIGRDGDIAALEALLCPRVVVTLTGEGGIGKSQVARAVARRHESALPGSTCVAALDNARGSDQVWDLLAGALHLPADASWPGAAAARRALRERRMLLVLDGCEQAVQHIAELAAAILEDCPGVSLLATSREVLRVPGERIYRLGPLALDPGAATATTRECAAVQAFRQYAADHEGAAPTAQWQVAVLDICRQLDGNPLAIKLAARRAGELGLDALRRRLSERLALLEDAEPGAPLRQRSLRAAMDWSYQLLPPTEQRVFRELAELAQPFTLAQVLARQRGSALDSWDLLEAITALADKSLVATDHGDQPTYRLSQTAMLYARAMGHTGSAKPGTAFAARPAKRARTP